ncbi:MAG: Helix-turn-helix domain [Acidobacteriota bacterium]|jgi:excisionase family DNA binding protein|nr:Helix-turn-helix domain [Acidobacteriota bacterium]
MSTKRQQGRAAVAEAAEPRLKLVAPPADVPHYLTLPEVAAMLRCQPSTIYQLVHKRRIPFRKRGRQLLFEAREIDQWTKDCAGR